MENIPRVQFAITISFILATLLIKMAATQAEKCSTETITDWETNVISHNLELLVSLKIMNLMDQ